MITELKFCYKSYSVVGKLNRTMCHSLNMPKALLAHFDRLC